MADHVSTDPLTDATTVVLALVDDARKAMLLLRCAKKKTQVFINWNDYLGSEAIVTRRLGDEKATRTEWGLSTDKKATFYPGKDSDLIKKLMASDRFVAQVTPYNENPVTAVFSVAGLSEAAQPLLETREIK